MLPQNFAYYTNDQNVLFCRVRDRSLHLKKLNEIKRQKLPNPQEHYTLSRQKQIYNEEQRLKEIYEKNTRMALNIAKIQNRNATLKTGPSPLRSSLHRSKNQSLKRIDEENETLCRRILSKQSSISFKQNLEEFKEHLKIRRRLLRVSHQFELEDKVLRKENKHLRSRSTYNL